jgi:hypothetical protein
LEKVLRGLGGAEVVDRLKSIELTGKTVRPTAGGKTIEFPVVTRIVYPDRYRQDLTLPSGQGRVTTIVSPTGSFLVTSVGTVPMPDDQRHQIETTIMRNPISLMKSRRDQTFTAMGHGTAEIEGSRLELLEVLAGGEATTLALDPVTGRVHVVRYTHRDISAVPKEETEIAYSDFREVQGVVYPFEAIGKIGGQTAFLNRLDTVRANPQMDLSLFSVSLPPMERTTP